LDLPAFEVACGSGIEVTDEEIGAAVDALIEKNKEALLTSRYCFPINQFMYAMKEGRMKWADGKKVKDVLDAKILALLGEKTEADMEVAANVLK
jgi:glutaminyl-tRNA synthetase